MFFKIDILKKFAIFTRKYLCWNHFLIGFFKNNFFYKTPLVGAFGITFYIYGKKFLKIVNKLFPPWWAANFHILSKGEYISFHFVFNTTKKSALSQQQKHTKSYIICSKLKKTERRGCWLWTAKDFLIMFK